MTDQELEWRFIRARLIGYGMYLKEELQNAIITHRIHPAATCILTGIQKQLNTRDFISGSAAAALPVAE